MVNRYPGNPRTISICPRSERRLPVYRKPERGLAGRGRRQRRAIPHNMRTSQTPLLGSAGLRLVARSSHARSGSLRGLLP